MDRRLPEGIMDCVADMIENGIEHENPWRNNAFRDIGAELRRLGLTAEEAVELVEAHADGWEPALEPKALQNGLRYIRDWVFEPDRTVPSACKVLVEHGLCIHEGSEADCAFRETKRRIANDVQAPAVLNAAWCEFLGRYYKRTGRIAVHAFQAIAIKRAVEMLPGAAPICLGYREMVTIIRKHHNFKPRLEGLCAAVRILEDHRLVKTLERGKPGILGKRLANKYEVCVPLPPVPKRRRAPGSGRRNRHIIR